MSLNFDLQAIPEETRTVIAEADDPSGHYKKGDKIMSPVTNSLIWATVGIGIGEITQENVHEFYTRVRIQEALCGAYYRKFVDGEWQDQLITLEQVKAHIGLRTNVFPKRSHSEFLKQVTSEVAAKDKATITWQDDYQKVVQWARLAVESHYANVRHGVMENIIGRLEQALPDRDSYPALSKEGAELQECDLCSEEYKAGENDYGVCPKCEAESQNEG